MLFVAIDKMHHLRPFAAPGHKKVRLFGLKKLFLKRFTVRSTTRTLITDKNDHSAFTAIYFYLQKLQVGPGDAACRERQYATKNRARTKFLRKI